VPSLYQREIDLKIEMQVLEKVKSQKEAF